MAQIVFFQPQLFNPSKFVTSSTEIGGEAYAMNLGSFYNHGRGLFIVGTMRDQTRAYISKATLDESSYALDAMVDLTLSGAHEDVW